MAAHPGELARKLKAHLRQAEQLLTVLAEGTLHDREIVRAQLDAKDVARFCGFLRAMLSERRLREFEVAQGISRGISAALR